MFENKKFGGWIFFWGGGEGRVCIVMKEFSK